MYWALFGLSLFALVFLVQVIWAWRFALLFPTRNRPISKRPLPKAAVILSLRGGDPNLSACLDQLLRQDYPDYEVRIVIDNLEDPAWPIVERVLAQHESSKVHLQILEPQGTCSLKMSALVQAIGELDDSFEAVVLIDADVIPHPGWLRELTAPLSDPTIGATNGIRWYYPADQEWGTLVRYMWNAGANTQMQSLGIAWGGSLAFRADVLRRSNLLDHWARSFCEDTGTRRALHQLGLELCFVPEATMINSEATDLSCCFQFIRRQLVCARLYHEHWSLILAAGLATGAGMLGAAVLGLLALVQGEWLLCAAAAVGPMLYSLGVGSALLHCERHIQRRGAGAVTYSWRMLLAGPLSLAFHLVALVSACRLRRVDWRGVTYEIHGPLQVRMLEYQPYRDPSTAPQPLTSIV